MTDNGTSEITPGERRELRSVVRGQFKVLRTEVDRRQAELKGEIEAELLARYRDQDQAVADANSEVAAAEEDFIRALQRIGEALKASHPELSIEAGRSDITGRVGFSATDHQRSQERRTAMAAIPGRVGDAKLRLDRAEQDMLRELSAGALATDQAREFLAKIPSVGELVPRAVLAEIERGLEDSP